MDNKKAIEILQRLRVLGASDEIINFIDGMIKNTEAVEKITKKQEKILDEDFKS